MNIKFSDPDGKIGALLAALKKRWLLLAGLALGALLLCLPKSTDSRSENTETQTVPEFSLESEEKKIAQALGKIEGVGKVSVILTLKSSAEQRIARDESTQYRSLDAGYELQSESSVVKIQEGSGMQQPVTLKYIYPEYKGALIIAENAGSAIKLEITNAVAALTGLSSDKITVAIGR